ncbi:hypothetical protein PMIN01_11824 [Paraphaeosphaeria minitans]|uniref:Uncharacterized protein n=1 Tax=Paraphaeosphaeria minitans TaxID=565426 RepID=A0A9P6G6A2_9PLEO|nr:hypothetical protein PMIN01_11824 [Paraphaeosphaeria minitans]
MQEYQNLQKQRKGIISEGKLLEAAINTGQGEPGDEDQIKVLHQQLEEVDKKIAKLETQADSSLLTRDKGKDVSAPAGNVNATENVSAQTEYGNATEDIPAPTVSGQGTMMEIDTVQPTNVKPEESRNHQINRPTKSLVDDLNMTWDVDVETQHNESSLRDLYRQVFGHLCRNSTTRYCVRFGSAAAYSAKFESTLPPNSTYRGSRDVTQRSNRIVEKIVQLHRDKKEQLPMEILSKVQILCVYWDSKTGLGHEAEIDVLDPDFQGRRPNTRCFIYLDPTLYAKYNIENKSGYSHETRSIMKLCVEGNDDWQKSITFYNIAVRLENNFETHCMQGRPGRPEPLCELLDERVRGSRRSVSRYVSVEPSSPRQQTPRRQTPRQQNPRQQTPRRSPPRQKTPMLGQLQSHPPESQHRRSSSSMTPKEKFHREFLELFELGDDVTFEDLSEKQQILYPAQFTKWKAVNLPNTE